MKILLFAIILTGLINLNKCSLSKSSVKYQVAINTEPEAAGTVSPTGGDYKAGTMLEIKAKPDSGWTFVKWKGAVTGSRNPDSIAVSDSIKITAVFEKKDHDEAQFQDVVMLWGQITPNKLVLKPAFRMEAPVSVPHKKGPYTLSGYGQNGTQLFSFSFAGSPVADLSKEMHQFSFTIPADQVGIKKLQTIKLSSPNLKVSRQAVVPAQGTNMGAKAKPHLTVSRIDSKTVSIKWKNTRYKMALVKNAQTGEVIGFINNGGAEIKTDAQVLKIYLSDGVHTSKREINLESTMEKNK